MKMYILILIVLGIIFLFFILCYVVACWLMINFDNKSYKNVYGRKQENK